MKLSACIIVKNEEQHIERCLESIYPLVKKGIAEIILVDTGSKDKTIEIAKRYTDKIYFYEWMDNFAEARNFSISKAKGEYLLIIDADEEIEKEALNKIIDLFNANNYKKFNAFTFKEKNFTDKDLKNFGIFTRAFIFKNSKDFFYTGSIHEQPSILRPSQNLDANILHYGYITNEETKEKKFIRNSKMLKEALIKDPNNLYYRYQLAVTYEVNYNLTEAVEQIDIIINTIKNKKHNQLYLLYYSAAARIYNSYKLYSRVIDICNIGLEKQYDFIDLIYSELGAFYAMENYQEALNYSEKYLNLLKSFKEHDIFHDTRFLFHSLNCKDEIEKVKLICLYKTKKIELKELIKKCKFENISELSSRYIIEDLVRFIWNYNIDNNMHIDDLKCLKDTIDFVFQRTLNSKQLVPLSKEQNLYIIDKYFKLGKTFLEIGQILNEEEKVFFKEIDKCFKNVQNSDLLNAIKSLKYAVEKNPNMARPMEIYIEELLRKYKTLKEENEMGRLVKELKDKIEWLIQKGYIEEAEGLIKECEKYNIDEQLYSMKAIILIMKNKIEEAEELLITAVKKYSECSDLIYNLAYVYEISKNEVLALEYYKKALKLNKNKEIKDQLIIKINSIEKTNLNLNYIEKLAENYLFKKKDLERALIMYKKIVELNPDYPYGNYYIAECYLNMENINKSKEYFQKSMDLKQYNVSGFNNYAHLLSKTGENEKAIYYFEKAIQRADRKVEMFSNLLLTLNYDLFLSNEKMFLKHLEFAKLIGEKEEKFKSVKKSLDINKKLKIGYVSSDFRQHSVMYFISSSIVAHNKNNFEVFCYSDVLKEDRITESLKIFSDNWRNISSLADEEVEEGIKKDDIDVLVDLNGHSGKNRMSVFAKRAAPIQITWIGYPNTTGLKNMDYRITDSLADPEGVTDKYYSEKLIRMPESFLCYASGDYPDVAEQIPYYRNKKITFGCFNNMAKITEKTIKIWCDILKNVKNSVLVLKNTAFLDEDIINSSKEKFLKHGIKEEQLIFLKRDNNVKEHLSRYNDIDIALDTYPYNGTTTTCEAMYMGVPVISLAGERHASRVGVSLLTNVGLADFIAYSEEEYIEKAVCLAYDIKRLEKIKLKLRHNIKKSPLMQADKFTKELERIYRNLWIRHCEREDVAKQKTNLEFGE
ncbi:glycosyltransferase [Clostridium sp. BSD9I1]|uniref:O-linked N-acetylglucosamine transferase family protein n=1 Tax=Clostridium sp. BSD9I1 TaxID=2003589 RepID=UPI001646C4A3|nr:glycosyltransferase [Clostridium sp. BSD9I1]